MSPLRRDGDQMKPTDDEAEAFLKDYQDLVNKHKIAPYFPKGQEGFELGKFDEEKIAVYMKYKHVPGRYVFVVAKPEFHNGEWVIYDCR